MGSDEGMFPVESKTGIKIMSINLLLEKEDAPVVWRGPVISGVINQFWQEVLWGDVDYMFVDMPPGTGDVPLTVFQSLPVDGIIIVTTPQDLVTMIVKKAYNMAKMMNVPIIGLVENMSYFECPDCKKKYNIFGESKIDEVAKELGVPVLARLPIDPKTASLVDKMPPSRAMVRAILRRGGALRRQGDSSHNRQASEINGKILYSLPKCDALSGHKTTFTKTPVLFAGVFSILSIEL